MEHLALKLAAKFAEQKVPKLPIDLFLCFAVGEEHFVSGENITLCFGDGFSEF